MFSCSVSIHRSWTSCHSSVRVIKSRTGIYFERHIHRCTPMSLPQHHTTSVPSIYSLRPYPYPSRLYHLSLSDSYSFQPSPYRHHHSHSHSSA